MPFVLRERDTQRRADALICARQLTCSSKGMTAILEVVFPKAQALGLHADKDRIAAIQTNRSPPRRNYINHLLAEALARNVRSNRY